jgi:hypothetical protein
MLRSLQYQSEPKEVASMRPFAGGRPTLPVLLALLLLGLAVRVPAAETPAPGADAAAAAMERLKTLSGEWTGKAGHGAQPFPVTVTYRVTGAGSAVVETLFAGTPHEMMTVYHLEAGELVLTHYCATGNHPRMRLDRSSSDPTTLSFAFAGATNFDPAVAMHMHSGHIHQIDADHIEAQWVSWDKGKPTGEAARFVLTRSKP